MRSISISHPPSLTHTLSFANVALRLSHHHDQKALNQSLQSFTLLAFQLCHHFLPLTPFSPHLLITPSIPDVYSLIYGSLEIKGAASHAFIYVCTHWVFAFTQIIYPPDNRSKIVWVVTPCNKQQTKKYICICIYPHLHRYLFFLQKIHFVLLRRYYFSLLSNSIITLIYCSELKVNQKFFQYILQCIRVV